MNAVPRPKAAQAIPRTIESLRDEIATLERSASDMRRAESAARTSLPALIAQGDAAGIADARETIKLAEAKLKRAVSDLEHTREALRVAQMRDTAVTAAQSYRLIEKSVRDAQEDLVTLADSIVAFGNAWKKAGGAIDSVDALLRNSGVTPDVDVLRTKFVAMVNMSLHLETDGVFGRAHTLDSPHQLRQSGLADLKLKAEDYATQYLRRARSKLGSNP